MADAFNLTNAASEILIHIVSIFMAQRHHDGQSTVRRAAVGETRPNNLQGLNCNVQVRRVARIMQKYRLSRQ